MANVVAKTVNTFSLSFILFIFSLCLIALPTQGWGANFSSCPQNFYAKSAPEHTNTKVLQQSIPLCFKGFATLYSGLSRTPLWSAEHLTRDRLFQAENIPRDDSFHSESRLPERMQAELSDYKGSGFDRGHLAPNADMADVDQQYDSFSLANMIPQSPKNNRQVWKNLESVTRYLTKKHGETYVVTGVAFNGKKVIQLKKRVIIPSHVFKAVYIPELDVAAAYYAPNNNSLEVDVISIEQLTRETGIDPFPTIKRSVKSNAYDLPVQLGDIENRETFENTAQSEEEDPLWLQILIEIIKWLVNNFSPK